MNLASKAKALEQFFGTNEEGPHIIFKEDWAFDIIRKDGTIKQYVPTPTGKKIHELILTPHEAEVIYEQGPFGSGKSTTLQADIIHRARFVPAWKGRMRDSKAAFFRNTTGDLESTTLHTWLDWFGEMGHHHKRQKPILEYNHQFNFYDERNGESGIINLLILFLAMDDEKAMKRLFSLELTFAYLNEMRYLPYALLDIITGRIRRYPSRQNVEAIGASMSDIPFVVTADSNPPRHKHWICDYFERRKTKEWHLFKQPAGLIKSIDGEWMDNPAHDTYQHVVEGYYTKLARNKTEEFIKVYCLGEYGTSIDGEPVYKNVYNDDLHSRAGLKFNPALPILMGWDFGLTPACALLQQDGLGRFVLLKEFTSDRSGLTQFVKNIVRPWLDANTPWWSENYESMGDPAGAAASQTDERTCMDILASFGIKTEPAPTNSFIARVEAVKGLLTTLIEGVPALTVDRNGAPIIRDGFIVDYHYRQLRTINGIEDKYSEAPEKNEASHPHEALQYIVLKYKNPSTKEAVANEEYYSQCSREVA